jgi:copper chaperone CopZ
VEMQEVESACLEGKCEENVTTALTSLQGRYDDTVMVASASVSIGDSNVEEDTADKSEFDKCLCSRSWQKLACYHLMDRSTKVIFPVLSVSQGRHFN